MPEKLPTNKEEKTFYFLEVGRLISPLEKILESLNDSIENGEYDLIIGIDASGRVPALIIDEYVSRVYEEKGYPEPLKKFLAGRPENRSEVEDQIKKWNPQKKVLIVEDTIAMGRSIEELCGVLKYLNITFDIIAVGKALFVGDLKHLGSDRLVTGMTGTPDIYRKRDKSGVEKSSGRTFSEPYKNEMPESHQEVIQDTINKTREDVDLVVDELMKWRADKYKNNE